MHAGLTKILFAVVVAFCFTVSSQAAEKKGAKTMSQNVLTVNGENIPLTHFSAHLHDNAEGQLQFRKELRILLSDREVPADALNGMVLDIPVEAMAKAGEIRGLLIKLDPDDLGEALVELLLKTDNPMQPRVTQTLSSSKKDVIKNFAMTGKTVSGEIERMDSGESAFADMPTMSYFVRFKAQVTNEPAITADLKGKDAQNSPFAKLVYKKGDVLEKGDIGALKAMTSKQANIRNEVFLNNPEFHAGAKSFGAEMKDSIKSITRLVERGKRAVLILEDGSMNFVKEGNEWKFDN